MQGEVCEVKYVRWGTQGEVHEVRFTPGKIYMRWDM